MPGDVLPLYEPEGKELHQGFDGRAFYQNAANGDVPNGPSMSWHPPGRAGIGGSSIPGGGPEISIGADSQAGPATGHPNHSIQGQPGAVPGHMQASRALTPEELMALADRMEQDFIQRTREAEQPHQSAVEPTLARGYALSDRPPEWLAQYMENKQNGPSQVDILMNGKHAIERQQLRQLKDSM